MLAFSSLCIASAEGLQLLVSLGLELHAVRLTATSNQAVRPLVSQAAHLILNAIPRTNDYRDFSSEPLTLRLLSEHHGVDVVPESTHFR